MKLAGCVYAAILKAEQIKIDRGKTALQKIIYFTLPREVRNNLYIPFHFGPYSKTVQLIYEQLIENGYFNYDETSKYFSVKKKIPESNLNIPEEISNRLTRVLCFLSDNNTTKTQQIAFLSKVYFFLMGKTEINDTIYPYIKDKSRIYGWSELSDAPKTKIEHNINLSLNFQKVLGEVANVETH